MIPAHQRLYLLSLAGTQAVLWLIVEDKFIVLDSLPQPSDQRQFRDIMCVTLRCIESMAAVRALGQVHGYIGTTQQGAGSITLIRANGDADTGANGKILLLD